MRRERREFRLHDTIDKARGFALKMPDGTVALFDARTQDIDVFILGERPANWQRVAGLSRKQPNAQLNRSMVAHASGATMASRVDYPEISAAVKKSWEARKAKAAANV